MVEDNKVVQRNGVVFKYNTYTASSCLRSSQLPGADSQDVARLEGGVVPHSLEGVDNGVYATWRAKY